MQQFSCIWNRLYQLLLNYTQTQEDISFWKDIINLLNRAPSVFIHHSTPSQDGGERFDVAGSRVLSVTYAL
jgi:hypothetical protein